MTTFRSQVTHKESGKKSDTPLSVRGIHESNIMNQEISGESKKIQSAPKWVLVTDEMDLSVDGESKASVATNLSLGDPSPPAYRPAPSQVLGSYGYQPSPLRTQRGKASSGGSNLPPSLNMVPSVSRRFRFLSLSSNLGSVYVGTLIGALGNIGTVTNTTVKSFASSVRLHSVKVWPPAGASAFVEWSTSEGYVKDEIKDSSLPTGITVTKSLFFKPPSKSLAAFWQTSASNLLFNMFAPTGSIIDVHVDYTTCGAFPSVSNIASAVVVGSVYYLYLDGSSTHYYQPVGLPTTT